MSETGGRTSIESHTEYVRSRFRCLECGEYVSTRRKRCANCAKRAA
ncbi:hypothetical protein [Halogeometricum rufum]|nr:hypothetical protein [Halogeometricum rufum]